MNGPSFNPVPALVAKLLTVWVRTSERGRTIVPKRSGEECYLLTEKCYQLTVSTDRSAIMY